MLVTAVCVSSLIILIVLTDHGKIYFNSCYYSEPAGKASLVYGCIQRRPIDQYNGK